MRPVATLALGYRRSETSTIVRNFIGCTVGCDRT
jgi:hypothetical protein